MHGEQSADWLMQVVVVRPASRVAVPVADVVLHSPVHDHLVQIDLGSNRVIPSLARKPVVPITKLGHLGAVGDAAFVNFQIGANFNAIGALV